VARLAWADGKLERHHFARWAENHYYYVGPFADYLGYIYGNTPGHLTDAMTCDVALVRCASSRSRAMHLHALAFTTEVRTGR
jgi:hypothetical protein